MTLGYCGPFRPAAAWHSDSPYLTILLILHACASHERKGSRYAIIFETGSKYYSDLAISTTAIEITHAPISTTVPITASVSVAFAVFSFSSFPCAVTN